MWWDGGERAITAREKALIEEHSASSFSIPLIPAHTPGARWVADGHTDPHGRQYECERAALTLGHYTDDELANAVFLHGNEQPSMAALAAGKALPGIAYLTAAKERIRWLSRSLAAALAAQQPAAQEPVVWSVLQIGNTGSFYDPKGTRRAFTYADQPGNIVASKLGRATLSAANASAGDSIDRGLALLKSLHDQGFGVFQIGEYAAPPAQGIDLGDGVRAIAEERRRQVEAEGFSPATDAGYNAGELAKAALAYVQLAAMDLAAGGRDHIATGSPPACWPWHPVWWKPRNARRDLVRAGALIAAQLDVLVSARDAAPEVARG